MKAFCLAFLLIIASVNSKPLEGPGKINDLPAIDPYQPEKSPNVPIQLGERSKIISLLYCKDALFTHI